MISSDEESNIGINHANNNIYFGNLVKLNDKYTFFKGKTHHMKLSTNDSHIILNYKEFKIKYKLTWLKILSFKNSNYKILISTEDPLIIGSTNTNQTYESLGKSKLIQTIGKDKIFNNLEVQSMINNLSTLALKDDTIINYGILEETINEEIEIVKYKKKSNLMNVDQKNLLQMLQAFIYNISSSIIEYTMLLKSISNILENDNFLNLDKIDYYLSIHTQSYYFTNGYTLFYNNKSYFKKEFIILPLISLYLASSLILDSKLALLPDDKSTTEYKKNINYPLININISPFKLQITNDCILNKNRFIDQYYSYYSFIKITFSLPCDSKNNKLAHNTNYQVFIHNFLSKSIKIFNCEFMFLLVTTNCLKSNKAIYYNSTIMNEGFKEELFIFLGLDKIYQTEKRVFKIISRISLMFSNTASIELPSTVNINYKRDIMKRKFCFSDGCGEINQDLLKQLLLKYKSNSRQLTETQNCNAIQIRYLGLKGLLLKSSHIDGICFRKSMQKYIYNSNLQENYPQLFNSISIHDVSKYRKGSINKEILYVLACKGVSIEDIFSLFKKKLLDREMIKKQLSKVINSNNFNKVSNKIFKSYYTSLLSLNKLKFSISSSVLAYGAPDFHNILQENEVYLKVNNNKISKVIKGYAVLTKNPCISLNDIRLVKCIDNENTSKIYSNIENIIIFNSKGKIPLCQKIANSDFDGDMYFLCWNRKLVNLLFNSKKYNAEYFKFSNLHQESLELDDSFINFNKKIPYNQDNIIAKMKEALCFSIMNNYKLGFISSIINKEAESYIESKNIDSYNNLKLLSLAHSVEVDFTKTGITISKDQLLKIYNKTKSTKGKSMICNNFLVNMNNVDKFPSIQTKLKLLFKTIESQVISKTCNELSYREINKNIEEIHYYPLISNIIIISFKINKAKELLSNNQQLLDVLNSLKPICNEYKCNIKDIMRRNDILFQEELFNFFKFSKLDFLHKSISLEEKKNYIYYQTKVFNTLFINQLNNILVRENIESKELRDTILFLLSYHPNYLTSNEKDSRLISNQLFEAFEDLITSPNIELRKDYYYNKVLMLDLGCNLK